MKYPQQVIILIDYESLHALQGAFKVKCIKQYLRRLQRCRNWKKYEGLKTIKWGHEQESNFLKPNQNGIWELYKSNWTQAYADAPFPIVFQYSSWMFETTPLEPYNTDTNFTAVIVGLRSEFQYLKTKQLIPLFVAYPPLVGIKDQKNAKPFTNKSTQSQYIDDSCVADFVRYAAATESFLKRKGSKIEFYSPIYYDTNTKQEELKLTEPKQGFIYMDATVFGASRCSLQATFSSKNFDHARYIHDMLNIIGPIFFSISAGSPFLKGKIANTDAFLSGFWASLDDRTPSERDPNSSDYVPGGRGGVCPYYYWDSPINRPEYSDVFTGAREQDLDFVRKLSEELNVEIDEKLVLHLATVIRSDFVDAPEDYKDMPDEKLDIYENLSGRVLRTVRLKPPMDDDMGWLIEFRPMEIMLTADERSAMLLSIYMIVRLLHENEKINWYIPISKLQENYKRSEQKDAVLKERFFFRTNVYDQGEPVIEELTAKEILFGKGDYKGIMHEVDCALENSLKLCKHSRELIQCIKQFLFEKVSGERPTLAAWMRKYVDGHPDYLHNSILPRSTIDDMLKHLYKIQVGEVEDKAFSKIFPSWVPSGPTAFPECCQNYVKL